MNQHQMQQNLQFSIYDKPVVWIDLEMTGLDITKEKILEIGIVVTDERFNKQTLGPNLIVKCDEFTLSNMDEWNQSHHQKSGLIEQVKKSSIDIVDAEQVILGFLHDLNVPYNSGSLAGNCIHTDRKFIQKYMPNLFNFLSHKIIDVTTFKQLCWRWNNQVFKQRPKKLGGHRAHDDILESIEEMKHYVQFFVKKSS
ncbi:exonuclease rnase t and dna polymerase iii [Stylonychia lemnae]|uniref:Exonuclease rnase t and dna polymerase iii n=1 Tax=Stylonychia lemnae TaxID=5949 RepID=A0A078A163_STYLE|nr:exonuclease rnase t and dna polymerase iii [Stylonychia lemnae]|eukprot:CDW75820.1 exonuclease rnase t and dna polymerase iii [Stylonychia lemnae]